MRLEGVIRLMVAVSTEELQRRLQLLIQICENGVSSSHPLIHNLDNRELFGCLKLLDTAERELSPDNTFGDVPLSTMLDGIRGALLREAASRYEKHLKGELRGGDLT